MFLTEEFKKFTVVS